MSDKEGLQEGEMGLTNLANRTYYLCIEDRYAASVMHEWIRMYKPVRMHMRNANERKGIFGSFVLVIKDEDGAHLPFIERIAEMTKAKIEVV